jgi:hypothetical protein
MRRTTAFEKLAASGINAALALSLASLIPANFALSAVFVFFVYSLVCIAAKDSRDLGMVAVGSQWEHRYPIWQHLVYDCLYALSFSTLFVHLRFPLDLFLANMLILQLPCVLLTGTTLHGFLSGDMATIIDDHARI